MGIEMPLPASGDASYYVRALPALVGMGKRGGRVAGCAWVPGCLVRFPGIVRIPETSRCLLRHPSALPPLRASLSNRSIAWIR